MSEFVNTYMPYEGIPLLRGNLLEFLELDPVPSINSNLNPAVSDCGLQNQGLLPGENIEIDQDLKVLEGLLDFHGDTAAGQSNNNKSFDFKPYSPSSGSDSGLSSPGSAWGDRLSPSPDILSLDQTHEPSNTPDNGSSNEQYHLFENALPELSGIDMANAFGNQADFNYHPSGVAEMEVLPMYEVAAPATTSSPVHETEALLEELGIRLDPTPDTVELAPQLPSEASQNEIDFTPALNNIQLIQVPSHPSNVDGMIKVNYIESKPQVIERTATNAVDCVSESSKPKSGKKRKITSIEERKERKREQNKTAATRYRERKRSEMLKRDEHLAALKTKNTTLKDEKNRIHREIDYLRELLVEVYKLKGVI